MLDRELAYIALVARDAAAPAAVFERLGLRRTDLDDGHGGTVAAFAVGRSIVAVFPLGHPFVGPEAKEGVHHIALATPDLAEGLSLAGAVGLSAVTGKAVPGLGGRRRIELGSAPLCGVRTWLTEPLDARPQTSSAVERIDHIGVASADNMAAVAAWSGRLGCPLESQQTDIEVMIPVESFTSDKHGVVHHTRAPVPVGGLRVSFVTVGDTELEFLENFDPRHPAFVDRNAAGTTRQDQGPSPAISPSAGRACIISRSRRRISTPCWRISTGLASPLSTSAGGRVHARASSASSIRRGWAAFSSTSTSARRGLEPLVAIERCRAGRVVVDDRCRIVAAE